MYIYNLFTFHTYYEGPFAKSLNGVDIAWIVGLAVTSVTYILVTRGLKVEDEQAAIDESDRTLATMA
jgi:purine-cytosine permease-like protein